MDRSCDPDCVWSRLNELYVALESVILPTSTEVAMAVLDIPATILSRPELSLLSLLVNASRKSELSLLLL